MKKDAFYFPHFCNARGDRKLKRVLKDLGIEGYGIYFMLLEVLREQIDFRYPINDVDLLADEFGTSEAKISAVIKSYDLFQVDTENNFFSLKQILYLQPYIEKTERARNAAKIKWNKIKELNQNNDANADAFAVHLECAGNARKEKETKPNQTKEDETKEKELVSENPAAQISPSEPIFKEGLNTEKKEGVDGRKKSKEPIEIRIKEFKESLYPFIDTRGGDYTTEMIKAFFDYWSEPTQSATKLMRKELERTWDTAKRLANWKRIDDNRKPQTFNTHGTQQQSNDQKRASRHALNDIAQQVILSIDSQNR